MKKQLSIVKIGGNVINNTAQLNAFLKDFAAPHAGLALASSAAAYLNAVLLFRGLKKRQVYTPERGWMRLGIAVILACTAMGAILLFMTHDFDSWLQATAGLRVKNLALTIGFGVIVYIFTAMVFGLKTHDLSRGAN